MYGEGNGTPLQYSCLENPMEGGAWHVIVHVVAKSPTGLSNFTFTCTKQLSWTLRQFCQWKPALKINVYERQAKLGFQVPV